MIIRNYSSSAIRQFSIAKRMSPVYTPEFQASLDYVLKLDPSLSSVVETHVFPAFIHPKPENQSSFQYLVRNISSQQVSGAAGNAISKRFLELTGGEDNQFPTPEKSLNFNVEQLRTAGLSMRKAEYVRGLAQAYIDGELSDEILKNADDDEVVDKIVSIRGLGPWTAQMFLMFYLHRSDVYSPADVGIQRGYRNYIKARPNLIKDLAENPSAPASPGKSKKARAKVALPPDLKDMERIIGRFAPHRSAFQMILWKISDIKMNTVEARDEDATKNRSEHMSHKRPPEEDNKIEVIEKSSETAEAIDNQVATEKARKQPVKRRRKVAT